MWVVIFSELYGFFICKEPPSTPFSDLICILVWLEKIVEKLNLNFIRSSSKWNDMETRKFSIFVSSLKLEWKTAKIITLIEVVSSEIIGNIFTCCP